MRTDLRITDTYWQQLQTHLLAPDGYERAAVLLCGTLDTRDLRALLVREVVPLTDDDLLAAGELHLSISPVALARLAKRARGMDATIVICHSHPFPGAVRASTLDLETEEDLCGRALAQRLAPRSVGALVLGPEGFDGRLWDQNGAVALERITIIGDQIVQWPAPEAEIMHISCDERVDRQTRSWGRAGQAQLADAHIIVVGCGGTGSHVALQLAHLGVGRSTLVDDDVVERSNLSRILGSRPADIGTFKVDVLAREIRQITPDAEVTIIPRSVLDVDPRQLAVADIVMCCTDGHGSRALLNELTQQYLVPVIDLGVEIVPTVGGANAGGGVRILLPGRACLQCAGTLDPAQVREEYLSPEQRAVEQERGYIRDVSEPAPSVIALNGVVASLAVLEACQLLTGVLGSGKARLLLRAGERRLTTTTVSGDLRCYVCGKAGLLARGDATSIATRWRAPGDTAA